MDEPHTAKAYQADFDLLIIVNDRRLTDRVQYWSTAEERLDRELGITKTLPTPVNFAVHTLGEVDKGLREGRYFFIAIAQDGMALYQTDTSLERGPPRRRTVTPRSWSVCFRPIADIQVKLNYVEQQQ